ncbi:pyridoxal phosphate-dependent transferase [Alternaria rosae]|uniref:pyridoxal phosphate-dependent transferase n=1 Tax=Alternaria rosae TaxID=1187941 RepID=UPI001E8E5847|nr:pyridoxal phosphate-dependent transferase [Alternaria rosae]KAH6875591.1 pyridoxal phosphate-dependent transferase [Alternaria rosae]
MAKVPGGLWKNAIAVQVYGANTGVGKTVFSTLLGAHFGRASLKSRASPLRHGPYKVQYVKPVSTGPADEADDSYVHKYTGQRVSTLFKFDKAVSPHVAARGSEHIPSDELISQTVFKSVQKAAATLDQGRLFSIIETAGGVLSPGPSGTPQADIFRPLRLPAVLVGDHRLGGIASTISAAESLIMRGYDIDAVVCFDDKSQYENADYLKKYFMDMGIPAYKLHWIPNLKGVAPGTKEETQIMRNYYDTESDSTMVGTIAEELIHRHDQRLRRLGSMPYETEDKIWHPFTQHKHVKNANDILVIDSAYGDFFQVKHKGNEEVPHPENQTLYPAFDGSASWWTQGLGHGNPRLALEAAYAAGRYGHVMFAGATHEPALTLAQKILSGSPQGTRLRKVFYTDNGSTATEVGIKMALRASSKRYDWDSAKESIGVLGLKGSYHGDTIGAMDASEPCVFNEKVDWYRGRGFWFDYPTFMLKNGQWVVEPPEGMEGELGPTQTFENQDSIFDFATRGRSAQYEAYIKKTLDELVKKQGKKFGALVLEPVILGAGGMLFVDPLFQQSLVRVVRHYDFANGSMATEFPKDEDAWSGLPVMFDEVFTGLYRLGRFSAASFLDVHPDISVNAKLLTGGLLPLSITSASQSVFEAFLGDEKLEALLHGHSYTAHAVGCHVANTSLDIMEKLNFGHERSLAENKTTTVSRGSGNRVWSMWSDPFVKSVSNHERVEYVNALGSVLAVSLADEGGSGYTSSAAVGIRDALLHDVSESQVQIHSRILGNVIYLMASMTATRSQLAPIEAAFMEKLESVKKA